MTDTRNQIETLRALLPEIEGGEGPLADETLGQLICALKGALFNNVESLSTGELLIWEDNARKTYVKGYRNRYCCPDTNLQAADALVRNVLPGCGRNYVISDRHTAEASLFPSDNTEGHGEHDDICRAILAALVRAKIAELEVKQ